jgi:hypothetical protein
MGRSSVRSGRFGPADREASIYRYVPFDVPTGTMSVAVRLSFEAPAVIDLGVFDPHGFRGYSGGARDRFVITPEAATPGYLPGELPNGEWRVLLGLHRLPPDGTAWEVHVSLDEEAVPTLPPPPVPGPRPPARRLPAERGRRWIAGDLHAHTLHSDGTLTVEQLADHARQRGLDFLAVTDHNTVSHHPYLEPVGETYGVQLLPGQEVTKDEGHANCFGPIGWVDFREPADVWLDHTTSQGGLMSINHPVVPDCGWRLPMEGTAHLVELWHKTWDRTASAPLDWWQGVGGVPVGGSDFHNPDHADRVGAPTTLVEVPEDLPPVGAEAGEAVLEALSAGRVALSAEPDGPVLLRQGDDLLAVDADGLTIVAPDDTRRQVDRSVMALEGAPAGLHRLVDPAGRVMAMVP